MGGGPAGLEGPSVYYVCTSSADCCLFARRVCQQHLGVILVCTRGGVGDPDHGLFLRLARVLVTSRARPGACVVAAELLRTYILYAEGIQSSIQGSKGGLSQYKRSRRRMSGARMRTGFLECVARMLHGAATRVECKKTSKYHGPV